MKFDMFIYSSFQVTCMKFFICNARAWNKRNRVYCMSNTKNTRILFFYNASQLIWQIRNVIKQSLNINIRISLVKRVNLFLFHEKSWKITYEFQTKVDKGDFNWLLFTIENTKGAWMQQKRRKAVTCDIKCAICDVHFSMRILNLSPQLNKK